MNKTCPVLNDNQLFFQDALLKGILETSCGKSGGKKRNRKQRGGMTKEQIKTILVHTMNIAMLGMITYGIVTGPWQPALVELQAGYDMWMRNECGTTGNRLWSLVGAGNRFCTFMNKADGNVWGLLTNQATAQENIMTEVVSVLAIWQSYKGYRAIRNKIASKVAETLGTGPSLAASRSALTAPEGYALISKDDLSTLARAIAEEFTRDGMIDRINAVSEREADRILDGPNGAQVRSEVTRLTSAFNTDRGSDWDSQDTMSAEGYSQGSSQGSSQYYSQGTIADLPPMDEDEEKPLGSTKGGKRSKTYKRRKPSKRHKTYKSRTKKRNRK